MEAVVGQIQGLTCTRKEFEPFRTYPTTEANFKYTNNNSSSRSRRAVKSFKTEAKPSYKKYGGRIPELLGALEGRKKVEEALGPWEPRLDSKEMSIILKQQSNWERAVEIFRWFQEKECYKISVIHYNILLGILGRAKKWGYLKKFWEEMVRDKVTPTNVTYGTIIDAYGKADLKEEALLWLDRMAVQGLHPDEVTMSTVVHILKKSGEYDKAAQFFQDWSCGRSLPRGKARRNLSLNGVSNYTDKVMDLCNDDVQVERPRNPYTYNTLIDTYGKAGRLKEASDVFHDMLKEGINPNIVTFNTLIHICGSNGRLEEAEALMMKMEELRCVPDARTYNTLISLHAENDNVDRALCYFTKMKKAELIPNAVSYRTILYALSIRNMINEVHIVIQEIDKFGFDVEEFSQTTVIRMYIRLGRLNQAWAWFQRFHLDARMSSECYAAYIDAYGEQGYWLEAEKVFNCSQERGKKPSVLEFNVMIKAYGIAKVRDKALKLFESMGIQGVFPDRCTYSSLIQMLANSNCLNECIHYISKMQEQRFMPNSGSFSAVIAACGRLGKTAEAEKMYRWMLKDQVQADIIVYGALIDAFAEAGDVEKAVHYFHVMENAGFAANSVVCNSLMKVYSKCGFLKEAQETFKMMKALGDDVGIFSSNCMIDLYTRAGVVSEAQKIFQHLKERKQANEFSFAMMLSFYKRNGRYNEAIEIAKEMLESGFLTDILSFNNVIGLYVADGRLREAAKVLHKMLKLGVSPDKTTSRRLGTLLMKGWIPKWIVKQLESSHKDCNMQPLISTVYSIVGMNNEALEALRSLSELQILNPDLSFCNAIIYAFGSAGRIDEASKMLMRMRARGLEPDTTTYTYMIIAYGKLGLVEGVRRMFYQMKQKGLQPNDSTFTAVIDAYKSAGRNNLVKLVTQERDFTHYLQEYGDFT